MTRLFAIVLSLFITSQSQAADPFIFLASTTSTQNSGLFRHILPMFKMDTGVKVRVVAVGTGQALKLGRAGDVDALLVHHRESEERFVAEGHGLERRDVMYNDFVIVGPKDDPVGAKGAKDVADALRKIAASGAKFASRGDDSGTHKRELSLWKAAGIDPADHSGKWYRETGSGMGATLNTSVAMDAYVLSDRGTWLAFANKGSLAILVEGDPRLLNPYGVIPLDPKRHPHVRHKEAKAFVDWLTSDAGKAAIASFKVGGEQLFHPGPAPEAR